MLKTGVPGPRQTFTNYKGKTITTINSTYPITDGDTIIGACEISTDITRIKEMAERIADLSQELRSKEHAEKPGVTRAKSKISRKFFTVDDIVGQSAVMRDVKRQVVQVARTQSNDACVGKPAQARNWLSKPSIRHLTELMLPLSPKTAPPCLKDCWKAWFSAHPKAGSQAPRTARDSWNWHQAALCTWMKSIPCPWGSRQSC